MKCDRWKVHALPCKSLPYSSEVKYLRIQWTRHPIPPPTPYSADRTALSTLVRSVCNTLYSQYRFKYGFRYPINRSHSRSETEINWSCWEKDCFVWASIKRQIDFPARVLHSTRVAILFLWHRILSIVELFWHRSSFDLLPPYSASFYRSILEIRPSKFMYSTRIKPNNSIVWICLASACTSTVPTYKGKLLPT